MEIVKKKFRTRTGDTGSLTFLEGERDIPFAIRRVFYIYDLVHGAHRGFHAHKAVREYLICVHGSCKILLDDGVEKTVVPLDEPGEGLYVDAGIWREMYDFSPDAVLLVLASDYYDESDYIRDRDEFLAYVGKREDG